MKVTLRCEVAQPREKLSLDDDIVDSLKTATESFKETFSPPASDALAPSEAEVEAVDDAAAAEEQAEEDAS